MHPQRETSARIVEKGGDCVLPAKGNQGTLHEDVQVWFSDPEAQKEMLEYQHVDGEQGVGIGFQPAASRLTKKNGMHPRAITSS